MRLIYLFTFVFTVSCTGGIELKNVDYGALLHDGNSKVWIVDELLVNGIDASGVNAYSKDLFIFHENTTVNVIPMKALGDAGPKRGNFDLNSIKNQITFDMEKEMWYMEFKYITEDSLLLVPRIKNKPTFSMKLKPFPVL